MHHLFRGLDCIYIQKAFYIFGSKNTKMFLSFWTPGNWRFRQCTIRKQCKRGRHYTCYYRSPMASINMPSKNTDIFATALTVRELITGYPLYKNNDNNIWDVCIHLHRIDLHLFLKHLSQTNKKALLFITKKNTKKNYT